MSSPYVRHGSGSHHSKKNHVARRAFIVCGAVALCGGAVAVATPALGTNIVESIKNRAAALASVYKQLAQSLADGDPALFDELVHEAARQSAEFKDELDGPLWNVAEVVPVYGSDVKVARRLITLLNDFTNEALVPFSSVYKNTDFDNIITTSDGVIYVNIDTIEAISNTVIDMIPLIKEAIDTINSIGEVHIDQLKLAVSQIKDLIGPLAGEIDTLEPVLAMLPDILGANGKNRLYLIAAQNNVELRSTGGFPGAWCPVYVSNGAITLGETRSLYDYLPIDEANNVWMSDEEYVLFGGSGSYMPGNVNCNPDFPRDCEMWSEFWTIFHGSTVDGIIAMDPIFLQSLVGLTPGVQLEDGSWIDGTNTARSLMYDTYRNYMGDGTAMDEHFSMAAGLAAEAVMDSFSDFDIKQLIQVIQNAIDSGNLLIWLSNSNEEAVLESISNCTGAISLDETQPVLGIYLSNTSWSKIDWWLDMDIAIEPLPVESQEPASYSVDIEFTNTATWEEMELADAYIVGGNELKWGRDDILNDLFIYAPAGGCITDLQDNGRATLSEASYNGLQVIYGSIHPQIDNPVSISFTVVVSDKAEDDLKVRSTPTCQNVR